jgi:hypothetical protein
MKTVRKQLLLWSNLSTTNEAAVTLRCQVLWL